MKSSNLALRFEEHEQAAELAELRELPEACPRQPRRERPRPRFERRTIVIRDQGFRLFRVR